MRTTYYFEGKRITKKAAIEKVHGEEELKRMTMEAKETFMEDPWIQNSYFLGSGMLTIEFSI